LPDTGDKPQGRFARLATPKKIMPPEIARGWRQEKRYPAQNRQSGDRPKSLFRALCLTIDMHDFPGEFVTIDMHDLPGDCLTIDISSNLLL
jgi:hypothetical protein